MYSEYAPDRKGFSKMEIDHTRDKENLIESARIIALLEDVERNASKDEINKFRAATSHDMEYSGELAGHKIDVSSTNDGSGWRWVYSIDGFKITTPMDSNEGNEAIMKGWHKLYGNLA